MYVKGLVSTAYGTVYDKVRTLYPGRPSRDEPDEEDEASRSDGVELQWPPNPVIDPPCPSSGPTIEARIYHDGCLEAAAIVAEHARVSLCEAWGDDYTIDVSVHTPQVPWTPTDDWLDEWFRLLRGPLRADRAADANLLVVSSRGGQGEGGGMGAVVARGTVIERDCSVDDPVRQHGRSEGHEAVCIALHELGHCLGLGHEDGGKRRFTGVSAVTPMQSSYTSTGIWTPLLHPDAIERGPSR